MLRADVPVVEALRLVLCEGEDALGAVIEVIERSVSVEALRALINPRRAGPPLRWVRGRSPDLALTQHPFNRADERGAHGSAGETRDQSDDRDRTKVHARLLRRAGCLVCLNGRGGRLRVREVPRERT